MSRNMNEQAPNNVKIIGKLIECSFREGTLKDGRKYESANYSVRVEQTYDGKTEISEIPLSTFATMYTNNGSVHPGYKTIQDLKTLKTIQDYGEAEASRVRISSANLRENNFMTRSGQLVNTWQINTSFCNNAGTASDIANFQLVIFIMDMHDEIDREGDPTGRLIIKGGLVQFGGKLDVLEFVVEAPDKINYIQHNWEINSTVIVNGRIRITSQEVIKNAETGSWGEEFSETSTRMVRELVITGGSDNPIDEDNAYSTVDIKKAFNERKARIEQLQIANAAPKTTDNSSKYSWE